MKRDNFLLPAEWEEHEATWLVWPQNSKDWTGKFAAVKWFYCEIVKYLARSETVRIITGSEKVRNSAFSALSDSHVNIRNVELLICQSDRSWIRDSGPFFVFDNQENLKLLDFGFNGWAKYPNWHLDNKIPAYISEYLSLVREDENDTVLEGGSVDINGSGTLITTSQCLLNTTKQVRNKDFTKDDYERLFKRNFGISNTIWLGDGITGDDTNGHVDDFCRFVNKDTVVICSEDNQTDENYSVLRENFELLSDIKLENGSGVNVVTLPLPEPRYFRNQRLPASYANFYIGNGHVLVPTYNDPADLKALGILSDLFPGRKVVGINCSDVIWGFGGIHCLTKEQPAYYK